MNTQTFENIGDLANKTSFGGGLVAVWAWATSSEVLGLLGAIAAVGGMAITWYYKRKASKHFEAESTLRQERERLRIVEQQMRVDLMRTTGQAIPYKSEPDSGPIPLEACE